VAIPAAHNRLGGMMWAVWYASYQTARTPVELIESAGLVLIPSGSSGFHCVYPNRVEGVKLFTTYRQTL